MTRSPHPRRVREQGEAGSAVVEFVWLGILLLVPLVWIVISVFEVQRGAFAVSAAARLGQSSFSIVMASEGCSASRNRPTACGTSSGARSASSPQPRATSSPVSLLALTTTGRTCASAATTGRAEFNSPTLAPWIQIAPRGRSGRSSASRSRATPRASGRRAAPTRPEMLR